MTTNKDVDKSKRILQDLISARIRLIDISERYELDNNYDADIDEIDDEIEEMRERLIKLRI